MNHNAWKHETRKMYYFTGFHFWKRLKVGIRPFRQSACGYIVCMAEECVRVNTQVWQCVCVHMCVHRCRLICDFDSKLAVLVSSVAYSWENIKSVKYYFVFILNFHCETFCLKMLLVFSKRNVSVYSFEVFAVLLPAAWHVLKSLGCHSIWNYIHISM